MERWSNEVYCTDKMAVDAHRKHEHVGGDHGWVILTINPYGGLMGREICPLDEEEAIEMAKHILEFFDIPLEQEVSKKAGKTAEQRCESKK